MKTKSIQLTEKEFKAINEMILNHMKMLSMGWEDSQQQLMAFMNDLSNNLRRQWADGKEETFANSVVGEFLWKT